MRTGDGVRAVTGLRRSARPGDPTAARRLQEDLPPCRSGGLWQRGAVEEHGAVAWRLPVKPGAVRVARRLVQHVCRAWCIPTASDSAVLAVSELVGNVARAGGTHVRLCLSWTPRRLRVEVWDAIPASLSASRQVDVSLDGGRGLWLVRHSATRWGSHSTSRGKCVWAEFSL